MASKAPCGREAHVTDLDTVRLARKRVEVAEAAALRLAGALVDALVDSFRGVDACGPGALCAECRIRPELEAAVIERRLAVEALRLAERPYMAGLVSDGRAHDAMVKGGPRAGMEA